MQDFPYPAFFYNYIAKLQPQFLLVVKTAYRNFTYYCIILATCS